MPFVTNHGIRIHYQTEGSGVPLILQHGFTDSLVTWFDRGYVDTLRKFYRLVLIDARGHHLSDKPHDVAAYAEEHFAADILAVMDKLDIATAHYFGYSMGGLIGFAAARDAPERFRTMILGGASPYPFPPGAQDPMMPALREGPPGLCKLFEGYLTPEFEARVVANDMQAMIACRTRRFATPGFAASLASMTMPCLLFAGDADPIIDDVKRAAEEMPNAQFFSLPGYKHVQVLMESQAVLPRVVQFLQASAMA